MTDIEMQNMDDLEDGEIESDAEQETKETVIPPAAADVLTEPAPDPKPNGGDQCPERKVSKAEKRDKKKSKEHHGKDREYKLQKKDKSRKFLLPTPVEDDFAGNIEKAIRLALKKGPDHPGDYPLEAERFDSGVDDLDAKRKHKKRKKHDQPEKESSKKRKKRDDRNKGDEEMDEDEMMCVRGASPVFKQGHPDEEPYDNNYQSEEEYDSEGSAGSRGRERGGGAGGRGGRGSRGGRDRRTERSRRCAPHRRQDVHPQQDPDGVCLFYMQGKCYKGDECTFSHDAQPPRKLELCKFYLMDCCAKRDKCLYLHSDFPCKYYHTGLPCIYKDECKFAHGKPLSDSLKNILLKHIESAPKEILGEFPRLNRESAATMVAVTQNKLMQQYSPTKSNDKDKQSPIPSIFELNILKPNSYDENVINPNEQSHLLEYSNHNDKNKNFSKVRQSRWCDSPPSTPASSVSGSGSANPLASQNILNIQNLNGVLTHHQISELVNLGIENLNQLSSLTVIQLNQLGLTMNQINEIQLNTMSIQKLGLIQNQSSNTNAFLNNAKVTKDLDMRVSPILPDLKPNPVSAEVLGQDVDMRFQQNALLPNPMGDKDSRKIERESFQGDPRKPKNSIDIDQYTKDALKFSKFEKDDNIENEEFSESQSNIQKMESKIGLDIDHRLLQYVQDAAAASARLSHEAKEIKTESDTDIRLTSLPSKVQGFYSLPKKQDHKARRTTTDDEEDNLQIDEKWYSSDEDRSDKTFSKIKSPPQADQPKVYNPSLELESIEPSNVITKLGDLSKIDISAEVSKLLTSIKNNTPAEQITEPEKKNIPVKSRDPRNIKRSPERKSSTESVKKIESKAPKPGFVSIYNCVEGGSSDGRKRTDIDLRPIKDIDFRMPSFGDTDLRQTPGSGDVDLRLGLPFKPIPNYTPASEIDGSINSHPPMVFKLILVDVPRPDYTDIKNSTPKSQAALDPRLRKIFRLSIDESSLESVEKPPKPAAVRIDPRKRAQEPAISEKPISTKPAPLDLQAIIQTSNWYRELGSNQKILVNQQLASISMTLKMFHQENTSGRPFDLSEVRSNNVLCNIFTNLGITLNEKGEFTPMMLDITPPAMPPMNFSQNENFMGGNTGIMDPVGMMGMNPMGPPNMGPMGPMGNFDMRFQGSDPRGAPGLLGIAPNVPHNFDSSNFNGMPIFNNDNGARMPNFNNDNSSRMPFNNDSNPRMQNFNDNNFNSNFNDNNPGMYNNNAGGNNMNEFRGDNGNYEDKFYNRNQKGNDFKPFRGGRGGSWWYMWRGSLSRSRSGYSERGGGGYSERGGNWKGDRR